jgi:predicted  nucleic acid-binding Zn-ribbon protein
MAPNLLLHSASRKRGSKIEELTFESGVNLIVGPRNSGKTKWLQTVDYLLGDDIDADERTTDDIFTKYDSAAMSLSIGGQQFAIERSWKQAGMMSKVVVNGDALLLKDFRELLMRQLGILIVRYPQGNPLGTRAWPELGWRSLFRHMYRRQRFWSDFADQQFESEQHACLMQFLGVANSLFSPEFGTLAQRHKEVVSLESQREQFLSVLHQVTREVVNSKDLGVAITPDSVDTAVQHLQAEQIRVQSERDQLLERFQHSTPVGNTGAVSQLSNALVAVRSEKEANAEAVQKTEARLREVTDYRRLLDEEWSRMQRAMDAGSVLADLKVTHCPACDQAVSSHGQAFNQCYVCKQSISIPSGSFGTAVRRVQFEVEQLQAELAETDEMLEMLQRDVQKHKDQVAALQDRQSHIEASLQPIRSVVAAVLPPELVIYDMEMGRIQEQVRQLHRVKSSLDYREILSQRIDLLQQSIASMEEPVAAQRRDIDFPELASLMADGMNTYLNRISALKPGVYSQREVNFMFWDRGFRVKVGDGRWDRKLGGTLSLYFLLAYHYALLRLTTRPECHYPGLCLIDFPAELPDIVDEENFLVVPFIELLGRDDMKDSQLIIAGTGFAGLEGVRRLELLHVWK